MTELRIILSKNNYSHLQPAALIDGNQFKFYSNDLIKMKTCLKELLAKYEEPFTITLTFEVEDMHSFNLLCECLTFLYIEDKGYNNILTINSLLTKDAPTLNESFYESTKLLLDAIECLLIDINLLYITGDSIEPSNLKGKMLFDKLFDLNLKYKQLIVPNYRNDHFLERLQRLHYNKLDDLVESTQTLKKLLVNVKFYNAMMANALLSFDDDISIEENSMNQIQHDFNDLLNIFQTARDNMQSTVNDLLFSYSLINK